MNGLKDTRAIVTGGGSGIGRAICQRLALEGTHVCIFDRDLPGAQESEELIRSQGGKASSYRVDITNRAEIESALGTMASSVGEPDILINNAGWDRMINFLDTDPEFWDQIIGINLKGPLHMHHAVLPGMVHRGRGRVVNIASDAGRVGSSGESVYAACKGGMIAFTKTLAREHARQGLTFNVVCPGPTDTPLFDTVAGGAEAGQKIREGLKRAIPMKRLAQPEDLAGMVTFLASEEASFIAGQVISVSGGLTMHG